jgi:hypothetical protein
MRCLIENEVGHHANHMGFPSIRGCHGIVFVAASGLYGLHNYGGDNPDQWNDRAETFASFVTTHPSWRGGASALYGACFVTQVNGSGRGYGTSAPRVNWKAELVKFADKLQFFGPIWGYNLASSTCVPPCYVDFINVGNTSCIISVKSWDKTDSTSAPNTHPADHKLMRRSPNGIGYALQGTASMITKNVNADNLKTFQPEKLRG